MHYIKPLFYIHKVNDEFNRLYYELYYRVENRYVQVIDACFFTIQGAEASINELLDD